MTHVPRGLRVSQLNNNPYLLLVNYLRMYTVILLDNRGHVASWPTAARHTFGYRAEEIMGCSWAVLFPEQAVAHAKPKKELVVAIDATCLTRKAWRAKKISSFF